MSNDRIFGYTCCLLVVVVAVLLVVVLLLERRSIDPQQALGTAYTGYTGYTGYSFWLLLIFVSIGVYICRSPIVALNGSE